MTVNRAAAFLAAWIAVAACGSAGPPQALASPTPSATASAAGAVSPTSLALPSPQPSAVPPSAPPSTPPIPPVSLTCPGPYQAGHPLVAAGVRYSETGYVSLAVLDVVDPLAPARVCTVISSQYPTQPIQWLSASEFLLVLTGQPNRWLDVDVARGSVTTLRELNGSTYLAILSPDRTWLATMELGAAGNRIVNLYGTSGGVRTLATYPPVGGPGAPSIYGFGGPTIEFSPDGSLLLAVDPFANYRDPNIPDLQVFDLQGSRLVSAPRGTWAVWDAKSLYYDGGDGKVYKWTRGAAAAAILQSSWLEPRVSPDGKTIAYVERVPSPAGGWTINLKVLNTSSGSATAPRASGQRIYPLFVSANLIWTSELVACDSCYGGGGPTGKVFAYDISTGVEQAVKLPALLEVLGIASLSTGA